MKVIDNYIIFLTFIPWIFVYFVNMLNKLNNIYYQKFSWKFFKSHLLEIFSIPTFILTLFFFFFSSFHLTFVDKYLFLFMCLYLGVDSFYEKKFLFSKEFFKKYVFEILLIVLIGCFPFIFLIVSHKLNITYKIMLIYLFFQYFIFLFVSFICKLFQKKVSK